MAEPHEPVDLGRPRSVHVVGAGGPGMNPIATVLAEMGHRVSGSDLKHSPGLERLRSLGCAISVGHDAALVDGVDLVLVSTAVPDDNVEVVAARRAGIPVVSRAPVLGAVSRQARTIGVAGTHGKTTTSSMLALILVEAGLYPSFIIGGEINEIGSGAVWDSRGEWFVVEADESDGTFLALEPEVALVSNIEPDHLEHWGGIEGLHRAFAEFSSRATGVLICPDDDEVARGLPAAARVTVGEGPTADVRISDYRADREGSRFALSTSMGQIELTLPFPGRHNARNAATATAAALEAGAQLDDVAAALGRFAGVARRYERRGEADGVTFIDDYAHLPSETRAAIEGALSGGWGRVVTVFQPHRYSRTAELWQDFADAFVGSDLLVLTDIYPAGEPVRPGITGRLLVRAVSEAHPDARVVYLPTLHEVEDYLAVELSAGDLCLTLGAGDITGLADRVIERLGDR